MCVCVCVIGILGEITALEEVKAILYPQMKVR